MAYQGIGTGTTPNDNTGDSLLTGAVKINSNFQEIYNALGDGSNINIIPSGTRMLFQQTSAPTGWTKDTTNVDNRALRVVSGTAGSGGSTAFTSVFASNRSVPLPQHNHGLSGGAVSLSGGGASGTFLTGVTLNQSSNEVPNSPDEVDVLNENTSITTTSGSVSYTSPSAIYTRPTVNNEGTADATMDFAVQYIDVIIAQRN